MRKDWPGYFILRGKTPVAATLDEHVAWAQENGGGFGIKVAHDAWDDIAVSTVFLPIDHSHDPDGPPIVFETMVFRGGSEGSLGEAGECQRYSTWEEAEEGHRKLVRQLRFKVIEGGRRA
jgi:hypothetical protein